MEAKAPTEPIPITEPHTLRELVDLLWAMGSTDFPYDRRGRSTLRVNPASYQAASEDDKVLLVNLASIYRLTIEHRQTSPHIAEFRA